MSDIILSKGTRREILLDKISKLSLKAGDLIIVRDRADFGMFVEMINGNIAFCEHACPILCVEGGLERATREDLIEALRFVDSQAAENASGAQALPFGIEKVERWETEFGDSAVYAKDYDKLLNLYRKAVQ